jgi:hypothetical protein
VAGAHVGPTSKLPLADATGVTTVLVWIATFIIILVWGSLYFVWYLITLPTPRVRTVWVRRRRFGHWN